MRTVGTFATSRAMRLGIGLLLAQSCMIAGGARAEDGEMMRVYMDHARVLKLETLVWAHMYDDTSLTVGMSVASSAECRTRVQPCPSFRRRGTVSA